MARENRQSVMFKDLAEKPVVVEFTAPDTSSDGGVLLLKAADEAMGLTPALADVMHDERQSGKVEHGIREMLQERIYGIACGYPDCNDAGRLSKDPAVRLACERRDDGLASQPTLSRLENAVKSTDLLRLGYALTDAVIAREEKRRNPKKVLRITIDMDPTEDPTYGEQQLTFFRSYYDNWCYLPMITTVQFDGEGEHHLVAPVLRPGNASRGAGATAILERLVPRLRKSFPKATIYVRMDGEFANPEVLAWLEAEGLQYLVNVGKNSVLMRFAEPFLKEARAQARKSGLTSKVYGETRYKAGKWKHDRRVVIKAEVTLLEGREPRDNPRFVVTSLKLKPKAVYALYALRGDVENRIRELKHGLRFDLTSCTSFKANQFRDFLAAAAYILLQEIRYQARGTECERAQVWTLRERLLKLAVMVKESVRRILVEAPRCCAWGDIWRVIAVRLGAVT